MENFIRIHQVEDENLCKDIINVFESEPHQDYKCHGMSGGVIQSNVKTSTDEQFCKRNYGRIFSRYVKHLTTHVANYMAEFGMPNLGIQNIQVQKYLPGEGFKKYHYERDVANPARTLTFMTYLNDVKNAGTDFRLQNLTTEAKKGQTVIWPCEFTHPHAGIISETDTKYIITGWYSYIEPIEGVMNVGDKSYDRVWAIGEDYPCPESHIYLMPKDHNPKYDLDIPYANFINSQAVDYADGSIYHHPNYDEMITDIKKRSA